MSFSSDDGTTFVLIKLRVIKFKGDNDGAEWTHLKYLTTKEILSDWKQSLWCGRCLLRCLCIEGGSDEGKKEGKRFVELNID